MNECKKFLSERRTYNKIIIVSDNAVAHYKSKKHFYGLIDENNSMKVERCFFGARHGKNECDALGGVVKSLVSRAVANRQSVVTDAASFVVAGRKLVGRGRHFFLVEKVPSISMPPLVAVTGTRSLHHAIVIDGYLLVRQNSCFCKFCLAGSFSRCSNAAWVGALKLANVQSLTYAPADGSVMAEACSKSFSLSSTLPQSSPLYQSSPLPQAMTSPVVSHTPDLFLSESQFSPVAVNLTPDLISPDPLLTFIVKTPCEVESHQSSPMAITKWSALVEPQSSPTLAEPQFSATLNFNTAQSSSSLCTRYTI